MLPRHESYSPASNSTGFQEINLLGVLMDLTNASAIVTGGAGGFGSATVRRLAQTGAKVVIADVSDERGEALAREVGSGSLYVSTYCMDEDAIATAVKAAAGLGPLRV
jgi:NAD(P)-dependent dehydrogenase (short-subunit alcohol dehydrogenase family)